MSVTLPTPRQHAAPLGLWRLRPLFGETIPQDALGLFFAQLAILLRSGKTIPDALQQASGVADAELQAICAAIALPLRNGVSLSRALAPWQRRFPEIVLPVLEVGETSGTLEGSAQRLAHAFERGAAIERRIRYSVFDPRLIIAVLVLDQVAHGFAPTLSAMLMQGLTTLVQLLLLYFVGRLVVQVAFRWEPLRYAIDTLKLALPDIGITLRNLAAARWARSFATLWQAGVPISHALEISSRSALNARYERALRKAASRTRQGCLLRESLADTQLLPRYLLDVLATGELTGNLGDSVERFATLLEEEAFARATRQFVTILMAGQVIGALLLLRAIGH